MKRPPRAVRGRLAAALLALASAPACGGGEGSAADAADAVDASGVDASVADTGAGDAVAGSDSDPGDGTVAADGAAQDAVSGDGASGDAATADAEADAGPPTSLAKAPQDLTYGALVAGPRPIDDAIAAMTSVVGAAAVDKAIHDLTPTAAGIMVSYGSSAESLPLEVAAKLPALALRSIAGLAAKVQDATKSHDAALPRFVVLGDGTVWAAGGRPLGGGTKGNLYRFPVGGPWQRFESVPNALTILDVASHDGALFAVGSSATPAEVAKGEHHATLWRSDDGGQFFDPILKIWNAGDGLAQLRWFVRDGAQLLALGRRLDAKGATIALPHVVWSPPSALPLAPTHPLKSIEPRAVVPTAQGAMLVGGQDLLAKGDPVLLRVGEAGIVALDAAGGTLLDGWVIASLETTLLLEQTAATTYRVRLLRADGSLELVWTGTSSIALECLAWIDGALLFGGQDGGLWIAPSAWKPGRAP